MNVSQKNATGDLSQDRSENPSTDSPHALVDHFFRHQYARLVATLTRRFGVRHWELIEDVVQQALQRALGSWSLKGVPPNPSAWLHTVAANLAVDVLRRDSRSTPLDDSHQFADNTSPPNPDVLETEVHDDLLRMIFVCCNPIVPPESQVALALKTLCGFGNREIARALLTTEVSVAKRITRAKKQLRESRIEPSELSADQLQERLPEVLSVVYVLFSEGYSSSTADRLIRDELCEEAVRLALILAQHSGTTGPNTAALLALLLFHAARLDARIDESGAMLLLKEQDRSQWDGRLMLEAFDWFRKATVGEQVTRYHAEAWIAAEHCRATTMDDINWARIAQAYDLLCAIMPSPIHALNRAIAIGRRDGATAGLEAFEAIDGGSQMEAYYLWHATKAELLRQTGDLKAAKVALQIAWNLAPTNAEKELICRKRDQLASDI